MQTESHCRGTKDNHYKCGISGIFYINKTMSKFSAHIVGTEVNQSQSPNALTEISNEIKNQNHPQMQDVMHDEAGEQGVDTLNEPNETLKMTKKKVLHEHESKFDIWNLSTLKKYNEFNLEEGTTLKNTQIALNNFEIDSDESEISYLSVIQQEKISKPFQLKFIDSSLKQNFNSQRNVEPKSRMKQKGLRKLSEQAYKIVRELGEATYKEVAMRLVRTIERQQEQDESEDERAESNIKRRVYDALNVLIAMDVLQKMGRKIVFPKGAKSEFVLQKEKKQLNSLIDQQSTKKQIIQRKKEALSQVTMKINMVDELVERNKVLKSEVSKRINLPFVCLHLTQSSTQSIQLLNSNKQFVVSTSEEYSFFGDIDFLIKGKLNIRK